MAVQLYAARTIEESMYNGGTRTFGLYEPFIDGAQIGYVSGGLPVGYTDKFYAHHITISLSNYTDAILAAETTNGNLATITLTGLSQMRDYFVACVRFNASGTPVSISNIEVIKTLADRIEVLPPQIVKTADWASDKFNDWFEQPNEPYANSTMFFSYYKQQDAELGDFIRVKYDVPTQATNSEEVQYDYTHILSVLGGLHGFSPRHDWHVELPLRSPPQGNLADLGQFECGVTMGDQAAAKAAYNNSHIPVSGLPADKAFAGYDISGDPSYPEVLHWSTCYGVPSTATHPSQLLPWAGTGWRIHATSGPKAYAGVKNIFTLDYSAVTKEVTIRVNGSVIVILGQTHNPPYYRKKYPHGHYALPVRLNLEWQELSPNPPSDGYYDIGAVGFQTACPMYYAGWSATTRAQGGVYGWWDAYAEVPHHDPTKHSLNNFFYVSNSSDGRGRYGSTMHAGYTVTPSSPYLYEDPSHRLIHFEELEPHDWTNYTIPTWSTELHRGRALPVHVPEGTRLAYVVLHGYQQYGTIVARVLDQNGVAISADLPITSVADAQPISIPENTATSIQIEVDIQYDGTTIDPTTMGDTQVAPAQDLWRPATPSLFVGFEAYFADPLDIPEFEPTVDASLGGLSLTAPATMALGTLSGTSGTVSASLDTLALTAPAALGLGALSGVTTAANQIRAPNGDVRILRNVDGTIRTFNLLA